MLIEANVSSVGIANTDIDDALVTQAKSQSNKNPKTQKRRTCFHCKKSGHFKRDCRKWKVSNKEEQRKSTASIISSQAFIIANVQSRNMEEQDK